jgi:NET1-associated nuclear protein 1 (U3 small nucleolar RNA-associated protein 17)
VDCTTVQWHANAVSDLGFTDDGTFLLSGGAEAVLVLWKLDDGTRQYLPRLGAPFKSISLCPSDSSVIGVALSNNVVHVINTASMTIRASVHGLQPARLCDAIGGMKPVNQKIGSDSAEKVQMLRPENVLEIHPETGHVVVAVSGAALQFYDVLHDKHVMELQVRIFREHSGNGACSGRGVQGGAAVLRCAA